MHQTSAHELHRQFTEGNTTAEEIVSHHLKRISQHDGTLNSFLKIYEDQALEKARTLDIKKQKNETLGRLAGVPIAVKDNIIMKGEITTCASKFLTNYRAPYQSTVMRLLEAEDALILGKTNLDEFAMGASGKHSGFSPTKNPWNLECSPGGSSSGSAAAVSAQFCPIALGSDTGGSIRQPAALCGITGFKPTYGRVSRFGLVAFGSSLDQIGPLTRCVKDAAMVMEIIGKHCKRDSTSINTPPVSYTQELEKTISSAKIGVPWAFLDQLEGEPRQNFEKSLEVYKSLGAQIVDVDLSMLKYGIAVYYILGTAEASTNLARFDGIRYGVRSKNATALEEVYTLSRQEGFGLEVKNRILLGTFVLSASQKETFYSKAQKVRTLIIKQLREAFNLCDVIALPSAPGPAFSLDIQSDPLHEYLQDLYTVGANLAGLPAISIPSGFTQNQLPLGLQIMGKQLHDAEVLRFAYAFEQAGDFTHAPHLGESQQ